MNQSINRCMMICMLVALFVSLPSPAQSAKEPVQINVAKGEEVSQWTYDQASGRIFAGVYNTNEVREYSSTDGSLVRSFSVEKPFQLKVLSSRLIVASKGLPNVTLFDLNKNKEDGKVSLSFPVISLFKGPGQPQWLGAIREEKRDKRDICRVDLKTRKITKTFDLAKTGRRISKCGYLHFIDSKQLVIDDSDSRGNRQVFEFDETTFSFKGRNYCKGYGVFIPGPNGRYSFAKNTMLDRLMTQTIRTFPGEPCVGHSSKDLVVSYKKGDLYFNSYSGKLLGKVATQKTKDRYRYNSSRSVPQAAPCFIIDEDRNAVVYGDDDSCFVVSLNQPGVELKRLVMLKAPAQITQVHGKEINLPLAFTDATIPTKSLELKASPEGMILKGNALLWTPGPADVGNKEVVVQASHGGVKDKVVIRVNIVNHMIEFQSAIKYATINGAGSLAGVVTSRSSSRISSAEEEKTVYIVDLAKGEVRATMKTKVPISHLVLANGLVYMVSDQSSQVLLWSLSDLEEKGKFFTEGSISEAFELPDGRVLFLTNRTNGQIHNGKTLSAAPYQNHVRYDQFRKVNAGYVWKGQVYDHDLETLQMITKVPYVDSMFDLQDKSYRHSSGPYLWNRRLESSRLIFAGLKNSVVSTFDSREWSGLTIHPDYPILLGISLREEKRENQSSRKWLSASFRTLMDGSEIENRIVYIPPDTQSSMYHYKPEVGVALHKATAYVWFHNVLLTVPIPETMAKAAKPLSFKETFPPELPVGKIEMFKLQAVGGNGKYRFKLANARDGVSLDESTGTLKIDTKKIWDQFKTQKIPPQQKSRGYSHRKFDITTFNLENALTKSNAFYEQFFGSELKGVPLFLPLDLEVRDEENQMASLTAVTLLMGPKKDVIQRIETLKKEKLAKGEELRAQQARYYSNNNPAQESKVTELEAKIKAMENGSDSVELKKRLDNLSQLVLELNAKVSQLEKKLDKAEKDKP